MNMNKQELLKKIQGLLLYLSGLLDKYKTMNLNLQKFHQGAIYFLGKDASPIDLAGDELGCAETLNEIYKKTFGEYMSPANILSTYRLYEAIKNSPKFVRTTSPEEGTIILSPTGYSSKGAKNGHVGIIGKAGIIMSNDSRSGLFLENYTLQSWKQYYGDKLGFPMYFFNVT